MPRAVVFTGPGRPLELVRFPAPEPRGAEVVVRMTTCTLCRSDLHTHAGRRAEPTPSVLGHEVVGRIEDEYPRHPQVSLREAVLAGGMVLNLSAQSPEEAIHEMASAILPDRLPSEVDIANLAVVRERELPTDVGLGVAIPHARCPGLSEPLVVFGRSAGGIR